MAEYDAEIEDLRARVHCGVVLERTPPPWRLDRRESTKRSLKYRRGKGEILIVSHEGRGWWDPTSEARGDIFGLVQRLEPGLNFGHVRKRLRQFAGVPPEFPSAKRGSAATSPDESVAQRWASRPMVWPNSPTWRYLALKRRLPASIIQAAIEADDVREGPSASAWFAHRGDDGAVAHVDIRGPAYTGSLKGGAKSLFRFPAGDFVRPRLVVAEAAIDALSVAALESLRSDTLYAAAGGGMGTGTIAALEAHLTAMSAGANAVLCGVTDANAAGDRFADRHRALAEASGVTFLRLRPPLEGSDWNDMLCFPRPGKCFAVRPGREEALSGIVDRPGTTMSVGGPATV